MRLFTRRHSERGVRWPILTADEERRAGKIEYLHAAGVTPATVELQIDARETRTCGRCSSGCCAEGPVLTVRRRIRELGRPSPHG